MAETRGTPRLPCACASLRRAARAVTQMYEEELRETGLRATQFTLLQVLERAGSMTQGELGAILSLDSTTLTRSLRPLIEAGWVRAVRGSDRRERHIQLTASGRQKVLDAMQSWRRAQHRLKKAIGPAWDDLERTLHIVASSAL